MNFNFWSSNLSQLTWILLLSDLQTFLSCHEFCFLILQHSQLTWILLSDLQTSPARTFRLNSRKLLKLFLLQPAHKNPLKPTTSSVFTRETDTSKIRIKIKLSPDTKYPFLFHSPTFIVWTMNVLFSCRAFGRVPNINEVCSRFFLRLRTHVWPFLCLLTCVLFVQTGKILS